VTCFLGSGKSLTIACLAYNLYRLRLSDEKTGRKRFAFKTLVIINDRLYLDHQLFSTVMEFMKGHNIHDVVRAETTSQMKSFLGKGRSPRVVVATLQKFAKACFSDDSGVSKGALSPCNSVAIIADEAHRSHV